MTFFRAAGQISVNPCLGTREDSMSHLDLRRETYLRRYQTLPKAPGRKSLSLPGKDAMRYDNVGHLVRPVQAHGRRRCMGNMCKSVGHAECSICDVGLCIPCFASYHTK